MPVHTPKEAKKNKRIKKKIKKLKGEGKSTKQAVAQAFNTARPNKRKKNTGHTFE